MNAEKFSQGVGRLLRRVMYYARRMYFSFMTRLGLRQSLLKNRLGKRAIMYHGVDKVGSIALNSRFIARDELRKHFEYYRKNFHIVSLDEYITLPAHESKLTITLTFDDGYAGCLKYVLPLLEEFEFYATFFITGAAESKCPVLWADIIDVFSSLNSRTIRANNEIFKKNMRGRYVCTKSGQSLKERCLVAGLSFKSSLMETIGDFGDDPRWIELEDYWRQMSIEDLRILSKSEYVTIGSHAYTHNRLDSMSLAEVEVELRKSIRFLEQITKSKIDVLAFPCGAFSEEVIRLARQLGFGKLLAADELSKEEASQPFLFGRMAINPNVEFEYQMYSILRGRYE
jgi:peptidoglycan/xylan/chitin deacetylase (PgdA/CDA1 family)